jgi:hypothetical protein
LMPNSKLSRNAEYVSNAQLSQASSPENRPLDSTKTLFLFAGGRRAYAACSARGTAIRRLESSALGAGSRVVSLAEFSLRRKPSITGSINHWLHA